MQNESSTTRSLSMSMWVDKYRPKKFSDLLGEDVRLIQSVY